jgi:predicted phage tail protein
MGRRAALWLILPFLGLVLACALAPAAQAYTYVVRPNTTITAGSWSVVPSGSIDSVLDDNVLSPSLPSTADDYVAEVGNGPQTFEVGLSDVALRPGENVTAVKSWAYARTGDARWLDSELRTGATVLASATWPASTPVQWLSMTHTGALTQSELDDLRQRRTLQGTGASSETTIYASYAEVATDMPPPAPTITSGPGVAGQSTSPSWSFTATPAAGFECRLEKGATVVSGWAACSSPATFAIGGSGDGTYTFGVRATDALGVAGADTSATYTLDRVAPDPPTIDSAPPSPTRNPLLAWSFTGEGGALHSCRLTRGAAVVVDWALCTTPFSHNLGSTPTDGAYTFEVKSTDMAGNAGTAASHTITFDGTPPAAPVITAAPPATGSSSAPSWSFTNEASTTPMCRLERGATVVSDWSTCTSPKTWALGGTDGTYTFRVRADDAAGNEGAVTTRTYVLDDEPPAAPVITGGPTGPTNAQTPQWTFTIEGGTTAECRIERSGTTVSDWAACSSPHTHNLTGQPDGSYTFLVRATDTAGNQGLAATRTFTRDRTLPVAPVITGGPPASSADPAPSFSFTHESGSTAECSITKGATVISAFAACSSPKGYDLTAHGDGAYVFHVRAVDEAGNTGPEVTRNYTLDRVEPVAPTITGRPAAVTNDTTPTWTFTASFDVVKYRCRIERGATVVSDYTVCTSPHTYTLTTDGTYTFKVRGSDDAANESTETSDTFTLDTVPPPPPTITGGPTGPSQNATPTFTWTAEAGATTQCYVDRNGAMLHDWAPCSGSRSYDFTLPGDGVYTFRVRATDVAGTTGNEATRTYTLDKTAPAPPTITGGPAAHSNDDSPVYSFTAEPGATFTCRLDDGTNPVSDWGPCSTPAGYDLSPPRPDGSYTFRVKAHDAAGNPSLEATRAYALDRVKPAAPNITSAPAADTPDDTPTFDFTAEAGTAVECRLERDGAVVRPFAPCAGPHTYDLTSDPDGTYRFTVHATDDAGNQGDDATRTFRLDTDPPAAPAITAGPTGDSRDDSPTYEWTAEPGATTRCQIERGGTIVSAFAPCTSPRTYDLSPPAADGAYTFTVRAFDAAGNQGPDATRTYTLDRSPPAQPTIASGPAADSTDDSPTYGFTAEAGATLRCELKRGATVISASSVCTSPRTYDVSGDGDGTYTFSVFAADAAGNAGDPATRVYTLDTTTPLSPVLDSRPGDDGRSRTPEWAFSTTEPNKTFECRLARGSTVLFDWGPCVSPRQYSLNLQPDGAYTFGVRAVNAAGTRSVPTTDVYRLDTNAPAAPVISGGPAADSTDATPEWSIAAEPGARLECHLERDGAMVSDWTACTSPAGYDLTAPGSDGAYTFRTRAWDAAGNEGAVASASYNLDRSTPTAPVLGANPPAAGSDATPTWEFTAEPGKTFECRLSRDGTPLGGFTACTSPHTPDLSGADGDYTLEVRAVNAAGTPSAVTSDDYELDRGVPSAPSITAGPPADSSDATPTWSFTGEAGARFACQVERGGTVVVAFTSCTSPETSNLVGQPDGTYTFLVHQTDAAGNESPDASRSYNLDRTVPAAPTIDSGPASPGPDKTPAWTLTGTSGLTLECRLTRGTTEVSAWADCASPRAYDLSSQPDGTYRLHARQYNPAGTRGPEVTSDYVLDATVPAAPVVTGAPGRVGNGSTPTWSFSAESGTTVECRLERGSVEVRPWAPCTSPRSFGLAGEPDGDYRFSVRATDSAGNTSAVSVDEHEVDRVPPAPPGITGAPGPLGRDRRPAWSFTGEAGATFECTIAGAAGAIDEWAVCSSPRGYDLGGQSDGAFGFGVRARDAAGNTSAAASSAYTLDTTPGAVTIEAGPGALGRERRPAWRFSGEEAASFECRLSLRDVPVADWNPCTSPHGFDLSGRPDGTFAFSLRASDPAGNLGPIGSVTYQLDTTPPEAPTIERRPESPGTDRTPTWRFDGEKDASFSCRVEGADSGAVSDWTLCASPFTADLARAENGRYRFLVRASDVAGNVGEPAAGAYELVPPAEPKDPPTDGGDKGRTGDVPPEAPDGAGPLTAKPTTPKPDEPTPKKRKPAARKRPSFPDPRLKPTPRSTAPTVAPKAPEKDERGGNFATRAVTDAVNAITRNPDKSVFPLSLLLLVLGFLAIQNRIDRSDPKLALAPTFADPDLEFRPPPGDD